jgi:hypothetical protein
MNEREQFEAVFSQPPFEFRLTRYGEDSPWSGHYVDYQEQLTWAGWKARAAIAKWGTPAQKTNQCGEVCERAKLCAICARGLEDTTAPVGAVPLTKEQRNRIVLTADTVSEAIDMVERHHGIKQGGQS